MNNEHSSTYLQRIWQKIKRALSEPEQISSTGIFISNENDSYITPNKRSKLDIKTQSLQDTFDQTAFMEVMKKLLTCSVCLEVRKQANQCQNGHLICINCTLSLQQSSSTKEINCPVCRVQLNGYYQRSLLAEQLVSELPTKCRFCSATMSIRQLSLHESDTCPARIINCQYTLFGCAWKGLAKQRKFHEALCNVGLSTVALASETVHLNLKNQFNYYERRNTQWQNTINKLRELNNGLKLFMKHLVLTKYKDQPGIKSSFKTTKLEIFRNQFQLKFNIIRDRKSQNNSMFFKLKYISKQNLTLNFFLHSIRHDDETFELDDNIHCHAFSEDEQNAGSYNIHFSKEKLESTGCLSEVLAAKYSLYLEIIFMVESSESLDNPNSGSSQLHASESISQAITNTRNSNPNSGNLVVALISSNSLATPANEANEEDPEEPYDNDEDAEEHVSNEQEDEEQENEEDDEQENEEDDEGTEEDLEENKAVELDSI